MEESEKVLNEVSKDRNRFCVTSRIAS